MPTDIKYRIGIGQANDDITTSEPVVLTPAFTFDSTIITFDSTIRTFDETK